MLTEGVLAGGMIFPRLPRYWCLFFPFSQKKISESGEWSEWSEWDSVKLVQVGIRIGNGEGLEIRGKVVSWMRF